MKCSIEISLYPLHPDYETIVLEFIEFLDEKKLTYKVNGMSTQLFGDLNQLFPAVQTAIENTWSKYGQASLVLKAIKTDVSPYEHKK
ncbi:MAG: YkoF family thiamine/hydroxymethylpyrimidine-binding protein [Flavobacteriales bacterium]